LWLAYCYVIMVVLRIVYHGFIFFYMDTATTAIYTLSLHDALPISCGRTAGRGPGGALRRAGEDARGRRRALGRLRRRGTHPERRDRKSTRLNSSHSQISYAVFCLKKKKISS